MLNALQPFFLSFMIGLAIGIERERSQAGGVKTIGMRTFILFSLLGTLSAEIHKPLLTLTVSSFVFAALLLSYFRATRINQSTANIGITTEMAAGTVFLLGYLVMHQRLVAVCIATVVLLILYSRRSLHRFAKERISTKEIEAALTILIISVGIVSFLPDKTVDPWGLLNPQKFGMIVLILAGLQFGGYIMIRVFGEQLGMILVGFFGGLVSSTAVFASLAHAKKSVSKSTGSGVAAGIYATIATLVAFLIVVAVAAPNLLHYISWPILAAILLGGISSWVFIKPNGEKELSITYENPLDITAVLKLALLIMGILLFVGAIKQYIGINALPIVAFITGLFEIHAVAFAIASLFKEQSITLIQATELLAIVAVASFISKFALVWIIAHNRFALMMSLYLAAMLATGCGIYILILP
ncbi:MgtC/SapB family protein [Legionella yabuuchiae]|uniref:MgtC/SapB family protein n=1 Tax=Legionella yabuuchiae TaxID=376727 RepID=UPI001054B349|nr:MgtC/SapB family protein [Legionella yabuuchiae]